MTTMQRMGIRSVGTSQRLDTSVCNRSFTPKGFRSSTELYKSHSLDPMQFLFVRFFIGIQKSEMIFVEEATEDRPNWYE